MTVNDGARQASLKTPVAGMAAQDELLDIKQAAAFLKVSETSLRRWTSQGRLPCLRVGRKRERRFQTSDLLAFLEIDPGSSPSSPSLPTATIPMAPGTHLCAIYSSAEGRARQAVAFLSDSLQSGTVCFIVADPQGQRDILARLERGFPGLDSAKEQGNVVVSEYASTAQEQYDYWERTFVAALSRGARSLRVLGDVSTGQLARSNPWSAVLEYERGYDRLFARRFPVITLCQYAVEQMPGVDLRDLYCCHRDTFAYPVERLID